MLIFLLVGASGFVIYSDVTCRYIGNRWIGIIGLLSIICSGFDLSAWLPYLLAVSTGVFLFAVRAFAGGDIKLILAYLLGINTEWWPAVMMIVTGLGGVMALAYLLYGCLTNNMKAVRQKGLPYGVPIAIGGCLGILLSTT